MEKTIEVKKLTKIYQLGAINYGTLYHDLQSFAARLTKKEDPNRTIAHFKTRDSANFTNLVHALSNVSFYVKKGEVMGIIGKNGAGKSVLLKILSRITGPTSGFAVLRGRVGAILEVGTGFHPELTGRENIYLNGAILGMRHSEIKNKLESIIAFSEIGRYIDTPVKRYSSGMYVRLAFAVAIHLEAEILIFDEVLAVGDEDFQKKCLKEIKKTVRSGRTVLFVSHSMAAIKRICDRVIVLDNGRFIACHKPSKAIRIYHDL